MTMTLLFAWWNLIYIVPFALALMYLGLFVFTGITFGDADADFDADADADLDADADGDVQVEAHVVGEHDGGFEHGADGGTALAHVPHGATALQVHEGHVAEGHADASGSLLMNLLSFLGLGKIPISLALMIFLFVWGISGFAINSALYGWLGASPILGVISMPIALLVSVLLTGAFAATIGRLIPKSDAAHHRRSDLVGRSGEAIYDIDSQFGMANVRGDQGDLFQIPCRTREGVGRISKGTRIVIFDYDREKSVFYVAPFDA
jgi:membrane protein implicated in regulation of membrane protease activity